MKASRNSRKQNTSNLGTNVLDTPTKPPKETPNKRTIFLPYLKYWVAQEILMIIFNTCQIDIQKSKYLTSFLMYL